jgi:hypothetical protein
MEAFEQFVAVALEDEGFVVSAGLKFVLRTKTRKKDRDEWQTHGYEVDLVGARCDQLVLASVKSFFGSAGVQAREVAGEGGDTKRYRMLNDPLIRDGIVEAASKRFGYPKEHVSLRLYAGKFAGKGGKDEAATRLWCASQRVGAGPIEVHTARQVVERVRAVALKDTYVNNPVVVALKVLVSAGLLDVSTPITEEALHRAEEELATEDVAL